MKAILPLLAALCIGGQPSSAPPILIAIRVESAPTTRGPWTVETNYIFARPMNQPARFFRVQYEQAPGGDGG